MRMSRGGGFPVTALLMLAVGAPSLPGEVPQRVAVSLPVSALVEGVTLEPGPYVMAIVGYDGGKATIRISSEGSSDVLASAPVTAFQAPDAAPRNAVKVVSREGGYYLDKLLLAGERTGFQFRN